MSGQADLVLNARNGVGEVVHFPLQQNLHRAGILAVTEVPAPDIPAAVQQQAVERAAQVAELKVFGGLEVPEIAAALETLVPQDMVGLGVLKQRYAFFTNDQGGLLDDLMVTRRGDHLFLVVNAGCKDADLAHMQAHLSDACNVEMLEDRALIALQGPHAEHILAEFCPEVTSMKFMDVEGIEIRDIDCIISRSGYSGEDGFEISIPADRAEFFVRRILDHPDCEPVGLGARDSLRLEAGLCLYGNDIDTSTSPVEAALEWAIQKARRKGGARAGGFPGAARILNELEQGAARRRVGLKPDGKQPVRAHAKLYADADGKVEILQPGMNDPVRDGDVIYVRESLF